MSLDQNTLFPPPVITAATPMVTRAGEVPLEVTPQPPVTVVTSAPMVTGLQLQKLLLQWLLLPPLPLL